MSGRVRMDDQDLYADGWEDGYLRALDDVVGHVDSMQPRAGRVVQLAAGVLRQPIDQLRAVRTAR